MKLFFYGELIRPCGPMVVNRNLYSVLADKIYFIKCTSGVLRRIERLLKILLSRVIICSGIPLDYELKFMFFLHKRIIYLMHGCAYLETGKKFKTEEAIMNSADLILCVSKLYRDEIASKIFPNSKDKMKVLYNAINWEEYDTLPLAKYRDPNRIILMGGGRKSKRNLQICMAIDRINKRKMMSLHVDVYGYFKDDDDSNEIAKFDCVTFHHVINHTDLLIELSKSKLSVLNSDFESFGLGIIEALICGCDVLFSKHVGCTDIIASLLPSDIINNPLDIDEIQNKILDVLIHSNNKRLLDSIDRISTSKEYSGQQLMNFALSL